MKRFISGSCMNIMRFFFIVALAVVNVKVEAQPATGTQVRQNFLETINTGENDENKVMRTPAPRAPQSDYKSTVNGQVETITINGVSFNMVKVEGGVFQMGATEEQGEDAYESEAPVHQVTIGDFLIGETEVTQQLWQAIMGENPSVYDGEDMPVQCIRYIDCETFFFKLNFLTNRHFRLPTEAEWEYAARGGKKAMPTKYAGSDDCDEVGWFCNNSGNIPHKVREKMPNELGLYDMSGNVDEWVIDSWNDYSDTPKNNPKVVNEGDEKVRRGGGCLDFQRHLRVSDRRGCSERMWNYDIGLRIAE